MKTPISYASDRTVSRASSSLPQAAQPTPGGKLKTAMTQSHPKRSYTLTALLTVIVLSSLAFAVTPAMAEFGIERFAVAAQNENGSRDVQAGSHPYSLTTTFLLNGPECKREAGSLICVPEGFLKDVTLELPPGLVADPIATPRCSYEEFSNLSPRAPDGGCQADTAIGVSTGYTRQEENGGKVEPEFEAFSSPVYNLVPPPGVAAEFGLIIAGQVPVLLQGSVRTGSDYGATTRATDINEAKWVAASKVTIWGVPADPVHNALRGGCLKVAAESEAPPEAVGYGLREGEDELELRSETELKEVGLPMSNGGDCESGAPPVPLLTNPTSCGEPETATLRVDDWNEPGNFLGGKGERTKSFAMPAMTGCGKLGVSSSLSVTPEKSTASAPSGLDAELQIPQEGLVTPTGLAASDVKDGTLVFPEGLQLNASAANGLAACSEEQVGFTELKELDPAGEPGVRTAQFMPRLENPVTHEQEATLCPAASRIGNVSAKSPLLEGELTGGVYLAAPQNFAGGVQENPFGSLIAMYMVLEEPKTGVLVKLPAKVVTNPVTGQVTGTLENTPQLPASSLKLEFYGGELASLATPAHCGPYSTSLSLTPWSDGPLFSTAAAEPFSIASGLSGGACPGSTLPFTPSATGGSLNRESGKYAPFTLTIARPDGDQTLKSFDLQLPPGLAATLASVPLCAEPAAAQGTCGEASKIGESTVYTGLGNSPFTLPGTVYLTGPYNGAPFGLVTVTSAEHVGPFNIGRVVVRSTLKVNETTGAANINTESTTIYNPDGGVENYAGLPVFVKGLPTQIKQIDANITRPEFTFNSTNCDGTAVSGTLAGHEGGNAGFSTPFQVRGCASLPFHPDFTASTRGNGTTKGHGASLTVKIAVKQGPGYKPGEEEANIAKVDTALPLALSSRLTTLQKACTEKQFAENPANCPPGSFIGAVKVTTPILPVPLEGPAILVSHGGRAFPDLVFLLQGDNVKIESVGNSDIKNGITYAKFEAVPDVPLTSIEVKLPEKENSLLGAIKNLCAPTVTKTVKEKVTVKRDGKNVKVTKKVTKTEPEALIMPTSMTGQNGAVLTQSTKIAVAGCAAAAKPKAKTSRKARKSSTKRGAKS
jgi:hypothetical protein